MPKKPEKKPALAAILRAALKRKKAAHSAYSLRALARDVGVSPAFLSNVMNGKKMPPRDRLEKFCYSLELDVLEREQVVKAVMLDDFGAKLFKPARAAKWAKRKTTEVSVTGGSAGLLSHWRNLAVLEGLTLHSPHNDPATLRERLGLSTTEWKQAIALLLREGLIREENGVWRKNDEHLYVAGGRSKKEVRDFHQMMIKKAEAELGKSSHEDYGRRLINGFTFALNPAQLERLKAKVIGFLDELTQEASAGACEEVYQCNFQLFPLTKKS